MAGLLSEDEYDSHPAFQHAHRPFWDLAHGLPQEWAQKPEHLALKLGVTASPAMQILLAPLSPPVTLASARRLRESIARVGEAAIARMGETTAGAAGTAARATEDGAQRAAGGRTGWNGTTGIRDEAGPTHGALQEPPAANPPLATMPDSATPPTQASPPVHPPGVAAPDAPMPHAGALDPHPATAASPHEPVGARPTDDLSVPPLSQGAARDEAIARGQAVMLGRRAEMSLPPEQRLQPQVEHSVLRQPQQGRQLPGVEQRAVADLNETFRPGRDGSGQRLPSNPWVASSPFSAMANDAGRIADRIAADMDPVVLRLMRGEAVPDATDAQRTAARTSQFFNLRPFYDALLGLGLTPQDALRRVQQEARALAGTSPRSDTITNQRSAALLQYLQALGEGLDPDTVRRLTGPGSGFQLIYRQHPELFEAALRGAAPLERRPKTSILDRALGGDHSAVPVDVHNFRATNMVFNDINPGQLPRDAFRSQAQYNRYLDAYRTAADGSPGPGMTDRELRRALDVAPPARRVDGQVLRDNYLVYNDVTTQVAQRLGVSPAEAQALMWFRYSDRTGLVSRPFTATEILDQRISVTAQILGVPPREVLALYARNAIPLAAVGGVAGMGPLQGLLDAEKEARQ